MLLGTPLLTGADIGAARAEARGSGADLSEGLGGTRGTCTDSVILGHVLEHAFMYCSWGRLGNRSFEGSCPRG